MPRGEPSCQGSSEYVWQREVEGISGRVTSGRSLPYFPKKRSVFAPSKKIYPKTLLCFFNNCIEKNQNKTHFEEGSCSHTSLRDGSRYQIGWIFGKVPNGSWPPTTGIILSITTMYVIPDYVKIYSWGQLKFIWFITATRLRFTALEIFFSGQHKAFASLTKCSQHYLRIFMNCPAVFEFLECMIWPVP